MKKFFLKPLCLGIMVCIAALTGCHNPFEPPEEISASQGRGLVVVSIGGIDDAAADGSARTIAPELGNFTKYTLIFTEPAGATPVADVVITSGRSAQLELGLGVWTITAVGSTGTEEGGYIDIARGSGTVTVTDQANAALTILLSPQPGGAQGTFSYSVTIPSGLTSAELIISPESDPDITIDLNTNPTDTQSLDPGQYLVRIRLQKGTGSTTMYAGLTEALHIYSNLTSTLLPMEFTNADFMEAVSEYDLTSMAPAPLLWAAPVTTLTGNQYTGTIAWKESDGNIPVTGIFKVNVVYIAVVTLTAKPDYTFTGVLADSFIHSDANTITNVADSGVITITFPPTDAQSITGVTVAPLSSSIAQGSAGIFTAMVTGTGSVVPPQTVTWTVAGNSDNGTTIAVDGTLTVAINESTFSTLTVKATSIVDETQYDTATVTVTAAPVINIASETDLAKIGVDSAYPLGGKYKITANLTLSNWVPIGDNTAPFFGVIDGDSKTITLQSFDSDVVSGKAYLGIFGYVKGGSTTSKAELKNLVLQSQINQNSDPATRQAIGTLAGYAENTDIVDITLQGAVTFDSTKTMYIGGIAGYIQTGTVVKDSKVAANLVIAPGSGGTNLTGTPVAAYSFVGGVAGIFVNGGEILNSHNTGNIQAFSTASGSQVFAGGIAGGSNYGGGTVYQGKIEDCSYTGNLHARATGFWTYAGGIAGTIVGGTVNDINSTTRIMRSFATGTISVEGTSSGNPYIGGIVGYNYVGALVSQSYFTGNVIASKSGDYTGGIAGYNSQTGAPNNSRIEDCWSSGTVTGFNNAGGIVGQNQINTYIRRSYSTAAVIAINTGATGVGGIAGMNASTQTDAITGCVALNPLLEMQTGASANIHRIVGAGSSTQHINNLAWSGMTVNTAGTTYTPAIGANEKDGADIAVQPSQAEYEALGWDFGSVWEMDIYGYPKLQWQTTVLARPPLAGPVPVVSVVNNNHYDTAISDYTNAGGKLTVSWQPVPGATSYDIYYAPRVTTAPEFSEAIAVTGVTGTSREITDAAIGENTMNYYVWIEANNSVGASAAGPHASTLDRFMGIWTADNEADGFMITNADTLYLMLWASWFNDDYAGEYDVLSYIRAVVPFEGGSETVNFNGKIGPAGIIVVEYDRSLDDNIAWSHLEGNYFNALYYYGLTGDETQRSAYMGFAADLAGTYGDPDYGCDVVDVNAAITKFTFAEKDEYIAPSEAASYDWESLD